MYVHTYVISNLRTCYSLKDYVDGLMYVHDIKMKIEFSKIKHLKTSITFASYIRSCYPGSQAPFWGEEVTSPAIVGLNTF